MNFLPTFNAILPVFVFLICLVILDSYKLVKFSTILFTLLLGCCAALLSLFLNNTLLEILNISRLLYVRYPGPLLEEFLKAFFIFILIRQGKMGFLVDAAINGFAVGAGFSLVENLYYLHALNQPQFMLWIIRGWGTAIMHGGTTAIFAILSMNYFCRYPKKKLVVFIPGFISAVLLHSLFNHFILSPVLMTIGQLLILPVLVVVVYSHSENTLQEWLEAGMDVDVWLLDYITTGRMYQTKVGEYLHSLKNKFSGEIVADMVCYVRLYLELALRAKGILLLKEQGFQPPEDPEILEKLQELKYLEKSIGKTGKLALSPILHTGIQELWQLGLIGKK